MEDENQLEKDEGMVVKRRRAHATSLAVNGVETKNVRTMKYLGAMLD